MGILGQLLSEKTGFEQGQTVYQTPQFPTHQLERPQEVGGVFEVGANGHDLVDEILDADDAVATKILLNQVVGGDGGALAVDLEEIHQLHSVLF